MYYSVLFYQFSLFTSELGPSWLPCGLLDFCHLMAALLCPNLSELPFTVFRILGSPAAILHPAEAGCHMARSSHQTLPNLISESGEKLEKGDIGRTI